MKQLVDWSEGKQTAGVMRWMDRSALDGLDLVPRLLAEVADDPDALEHRHLHLHGPLLHLPLEPSHPFSLLFSSWSERIPVGCGSLEETKKKTTAIGDLPGWVAKMSCGWWWASTEEWGYIAGVRLRDRKSVV